MSTKGGKRPVLRADKRTTKKTTRGRGAKPAGKKAAAVKRKPATRATKRRKTSRRRRGPIGWIQGLFSFVFRVLWSVTWRSAAVVALIVAAGVLYFYATLPSFAELIDGRTRGSVTLLDRDAEVYAWRGEQFDSITEIHEVSKHLKNAVVASEDKRFYWHLGVSPRGIASAVKINLSEGRGALSGHGGSTLTQQTAKLLCVGVPYDPTSGMTEAEYEADCRRGSIWRKAKEAVYALALEAKFTKDEILVIYLNRAYLGASARGFEAASQRYFGIPAAQLNPAQAAMLAGLLPAPTRYAPTSNLQRSQDRADTVIRLMHDQGYLTDAQRDEAWNRPATLSKAAEANAGGYFADWVMDTGPNFLTRDTTEDVVLSTTLDKRIQAAAEGALHDVFASKLKEGSEVQAAIVVMSADGAVRAMVGGRETKVSGAFNRATMAKRQTGSSFKPFVYAAAMDLGYTPLATVVDEPYCMEVPGSGQYCPNNYSRNFKGRVTLSDALKDSLNVPAVKVSEAVGRENVRTIASGFGIDNELAIGPALALGASESTLLEMTGAYAGILNGGRSVTPYGLNELRIQGDDEPLMGQGGGYGERVITEQAAGYLVYMMNQVVEAGTGRRANLGDRPAAGKTGTSQEARDAWFIGFTADYVTGVWMGYDDNTPLTGVTGSGLPAEIWHEAMLRIHEDTPITPLPMIAPDPGQAQLAGTRRTDGTANPGGNQRRQAPQRTGNVAERVLQDVLGLFGRGN